MSKSTLLLLVSTILLVNFGANAVEQLACIGAPAWGHIFVPSPLSCNHYIVCYNGQTHTGNCPFGHDFNARDQNCGIVGTVDCTQCATIGSVNLPDPKNCSSFIECMMGIRTVRTCPPGTLFDRNIASCNHAHLVQCPGDGGGDPGVTPPGPEIPCWSPPCPGDPGVTPPGPNDPNAPPACIPGGQVHHAHPTDCRRFFVCTNLILVEHECPSNLHWNDRVNACDLPQNAMCFRSTAAGLADDIDQADD